MMVQTEIGLLPEDWKVVRLEDHFKTFSTASFSRDEMSEQGEVLCVHYGDIHTKYGNIVDAIKDEIPHITTAQAARYKTLKDGDILLADASEDDEGIGKPIVIICHDKKVIAGLHILPLRKKEEELWDTTFPSYLFSGRMVKGQVERLSEGTKVNSITFNKIKDVLIPLLQDTTEQQNIASALSSIDKLIDDLSRTIHKKQLIREGAMEELLSGKKRLPGFTEEWVEKKIGELGYFLGGGTPDTKNEKYWNGSIPWISSSDLHENDIINITKSRFINTDAIKNSATKLIPINSLVIITRVGVGKVAVNSCELCTSQDFSSLIPYNDYVFYLAYAILRLLRKKKEETQGTSIRGVDLGTLREYDFSLPSDIREQHAIADILTSMDDEISLLESERAKYEQIRSGMMEELLTGKKRLK